MAEQEPNSGDLDPSSSVPKFYSLLLRFALGVLIIGLSAVGKLPSRSVVTFVGAIVVGAVLWMIPPFEIGPRPGLRNDFLSITYNRGKDAAMTIALWSGVATAFGALAGVVVGWLSQSEEIIDGAGVASVWGLIIGGASGAVVWAIHRIRADAIIILTRQNKSE